MTSAIPVLEQGDVEAAIARIDSRGAMRQLFTALAEGEATQPPQTLTLFPAGAGDFITYLGAIAREKIFGAKLSPYLPQSSGALVTAWTLLMSMDSGRPLLLCDSARLTVERTAATTALAIDLLAPPSATVLAIIGVGALGQAHLRHAASLRPWHEIRVYSRSLLASDRLQSQLTSLDPRVRIGANLSDTLADADVVMLCTSSATPVLDLELLTRPALITSISTNAHQAHEIPPHALASMDVYCDYREVTPRSAGEMVLAANHHGWSASAIRGDLAELSVGRAPSPTYQRHVLFRSIGLGLEDVAMANAVLKVREQP